MSESASQKREGRVSGWANSLMKRKPARIEISDYRIGDLRAESPVLVRKGSTIAGDVIAPVVEVSGLVYGYVACRHLTVAPGGQVWGDVYVNSLELAPTGKINGWICALDTGTVDLLRIGELGKGDLPDEDELPLSAGILEQMQASGLDVEANQKISHKRSGIWRQLRAEAALALMARAEIEATFDQRLEQALAELKAENARVRELLREANGEADDDPIQDLTSSVAAAHSVDSVNDPAEVELLRTQLRQATAAAQKYYGDLLWARAALRAAKKAKE